MKIELDSSTGICNLIPEKRDMMREQVISIRGLFDSLCESFGGHGDAEMRKIQKFMAGSSYREIIERVMKTPVEEKEPYESFISLSQQEKEDVIRRLYALVVTYLKIFTY